MNDRKEIKTEEISSYSRFITLSNKAICDVAISFDLARSAEKMMNWEYIGNDNKAWSEGPYLSAPANKKDIDRSYPYCMRSSIYMQKIAELVVDNNFNETGKTPMPISSIEPYQSRVEPIISKLLIIEQFELFKDFMKSCDGPYNAKQAKKWVGTLPENVLETISKLTERRNELTHNIEYEQPTMKEAVEFFYALRFFARTYFNKDSPRFVSIQAQVQK